MPRETKKLSAVAIKNATLPGRYSDGDGLYLVVGDKGARRWQFHFRFGRSNRIEMGLGSYPAVSLADARSKASDARRQLQNGINPLDARIRYPATEEQW